MFQQINHPRRRFLGTAAMTLAAAPLGMVASAKADTDKSRPPDLPAVKPGTNAHRIITGGVGHNLPQEAPQAFAKAIVDVDGY